MEFDALLLSRLQFAITVMFHYIFPPITIGLGLHLVVMEGLYLKTKNPIYLKLAKFWTKIFAVCFAMGVASGITMEFQFGTNWSEYSRFVGDVFGSVLAAEATIAFFLESAFLAILVFGWNRVPAWLHYFSTCMVSLGSILSAFWIVVANSWQQTPAGYHLVEHAGGFRAEITNFAELVFNPSTMPRITHVLIGAITLGGFCVISLSAWYLIRKRHEEFAKRGFVIGLMFALISSLAMLPSGHWQAIVVTEHQPPKMAAFEGLYETPEGGADIYMFGFPDDEAKKVQMGLAIPGGLSFLVHGDFDTPVQGLDQTPQEDWPPVWFTFQVYHLMIGLGMFFIGVTIFATFLLWRRKLWGATWFLWLLVPAWVLPLASNQLGWVAAEVGRQPWIVWGQLRTADALSQKVNASEVLFSNIMFIGIYSLMGVLWLYVLRLFLRRWNSPLPTGGPRGWCLYRPES